MVISTIIKMVIFFAGSLATMAYLIPALKKNDSVKKNKAGLLFVFTCIAILIVSVIEFLVYYKK